jgi:hypothetical protein
MQHFFQVVSERARTTDGHYLLRCSHILLSLGLVLMLASCCCLPYRPPPLDVTQAAVDGLHFFGERLPPEALAEFGYPDGQALARSDLRPPYRIHLIPKASLESYHPGDPVAGLLVATDRWLFPIASRGEVQALLEVDTLNGRPRAVTIGRRALARSLERIRHRWPAAEGYRLQYARAGIANMVIASFAGVERITPLAATGLVLDVPHPPDGVYGLYTPAELLPRLLPLVVAPFAGAQ